MPAKSSAQRRWVYGVKGKDFAELHHFNNKGKLPEHVKKEIPEWANFRAAADADVSCGTCSFFSGGLCTMFEDTPVASNMVCDEWKGIIHKDGPKYTADPVDRGLEGEDAMRMALMMRVLEPSQVGKEEITPTGISKLPRDSRVELERFWAEHPDLREGCVSKYGHDPVDSPEVYWPYGIAEPEHADVLAKIRGNGGVFSLPLVKQWEREEVAEARAEKAALAKGQANPCEVDLRVHGVTRHAGSGMIVYRMDTRDGHYVGRTNPTNHRALKGDILKVQAGHVGVDQNGDVQWLNANVVGHSDETAHSLKDLHGVASGRFEKDFAAGEGAPASGDTQSAPNMPSADTMSAVAATGPTVGSVHVNRPLRNISVAYMGRQRKLEVKKADSKKQVLYGVVLEPNVLDTQDDFMLSDQVEKAAHQYMRKVVRGQASVSKIQHRKMGFFKSRPSVVPVESFIAPCDFSYDGKEQVTKGTWVMALHVEDPSIWEQVLGGEFTGLSIGGTGIRQEASLPANMMGDQPVDWFTR